MGAAATIESALRSVSRVGGEVVLADSCSTDRTVDLAKLYPIRIVQLLHAHERCCGAGPQLGYQHSRGEFVYILDGDMQMLEGFLEQALESGAGELILNASVRARMDWAQIRDDWGADNPVERFEIRLRTRIARDKLTLYEIIGPSPEHLMLPCREVFARASRPVEVIGPVPELNTEARVVHAGFWR